MKQRSTIECWPCLIASIVFIWIVVCAIKVFW